MSTDANKKSLTRKSFLKMGTALSVTLVTWKLGLLKLFAESTNLVVSRTEGVYSEDRRRKLRKSQDNPTVKVLYSEFLEHPNSEKSHHLLHTTYTDRSARVNEQRKKGIKLPY